MSSSAGIGMFFKKVEKYCLNCKKGLNNDAVKPLCNTCNGKEKEFYIKYVLDIKAKEKAY